MQTRSRRLQSAAGFSMVEALVAIFVTLIIMATVFGFLASGARTSTVEMDRVDLQAQTRHALNQISRDVMFAGYGLPPEFPAFGNDAGPGISTATERIEIFGMAADMLGGEPIEVMSFDGQTARVAELPPSLALGQPVLVYDDLPIDGSWVLGLVSGIRSDPRYEVDVATEPGSSIHASNGTVSLPENVASYNRTPNGPPESGYLAPVSIVRYELESGTGESIPTLVRQLNWGERIHVAHIESMEIRYFVGGTLSGPVIQTMPRRGRTPYRQVAKDDRKIDDPRRQPGKKPTAPHDTTFELELPEPPVPQPNPGSVLDESNVVRAVRISLTGRSRQANLVGSSVLGHESSDDTGFVRQTLSTRVATRNLLSRAELRRIQLQTEGGHH